MNFYYYRWPLSLLLFGFLVRVIGALMKILHWQGSDITLIAATAVMVVAIVWLIVKLILLKKNSN